MNNEKLEIKIRLAIKAIMIIMITVIREITITGY